MKIWKMGSAVLVAAALASCGGGGDEAGDVSTFTVIPAEFTWTTVCPGGVIDAVSIHTVNGGRSPFRVRSSVAGLEVGLTNASNDFVPAPPESFTAGGDLILEGRDPKFAIRTSLPCESDVSVTVFDDFSNPASVSIKVEEATD